MKILIYDGLNYIVRYALSGKKYINTELVNIYPVVALLNDIKKNIIKYRPDEVYAVFDIGRDIKKKRILNTYKANRVNVGTGFKSRVNIDVDIYEDINSARSISLELLEHSPIKAYPSVLVEADTVIALLVRKYKELNQDNEIIIFSRDKDFFQLIDEGVTIVTNMNEDGLYKQVVLNKDNKTVALDILGFSIGKYVNIDMQSLSYFRAITGDISDNIVGVKGAGNKTIQTIIEFMHYDKKSGFESLDDFLDYIQSIIDRLMKLDNKNLRLVKSLKAIINSREVLRINLELMDFDHAINNLDVNTYQDILKLIKKEKTFNANEFIRIATKYDINSHEEFYVLMKTLEMLKEGNYSKLKTNEGLSNLYKLNNYLQSMLNRD